MKIAVAADHGGFELKNNILSLLKEKKYDVIDLGNSKYDPTDDYPDFAVMLANSVVSGKAEKGILICGSGVGACIAANKIKGARASVCHDVYSAHQGVEHDDMNILCLGARIIGNKLAEDLVFAFINAKFQTKESYIRRLEKVKNLEK